MARKSCAEWESAMSCMWAHYREPLRVALAKCSCFAKALMLTDLKQRVTVRWIIDWHSDPCQPNKLSIHFFEAIGFYFLLLQLLAFLFLSVAVPQCSVISNETNLANTAGLQAINFQNLINQVFYIYKQMYNAILGEKNLWFTCFSRFLTFPSEKT